MTAEQRLEVALLRITELEEDYALVDKALRKERKATQGLRNQLADKHRKAPNAGQVIEVIEHYVSELGHPRMVVAADDRKADAVRKAMGWGFTVERLKLAIDGLARYPYVWKAPNERFAQRRRYGLKGQRHDNLIWLLADSDRLQKFIDRALEDEPDERMVQVPARVLDRMHERVRRADEQAARFRELAVGSMELEHHAMLRLCWLEGESTDAYEAELRTSCPGALNGWAEYKARHPRGQARLHVVEGGRAA